ncbi:MAG: 16S rRNA processing protein RimM [Acidobacteriota bacterium]|nr:16S rRNA processing protein RimM [Acidobacteriota bacterium]
MNPESDSVLLAHLVRPQGRRGEILADLHTDYPSRFLEYPQVYLLPAGSNAAATEGRPMHVASYWQPTGRNQGRIVLQFDGVGDITAAEALAGLDVVIPLAQRLAPEAGAYYVSDLVGCVVLDRSTQIGAIREVRFPTTPDGSARLENAAPWLVVLDESGQEVLLPFAKDLLESVDLAARRVVMKLPEGLLEINRTTSS